MACLVHNNVALTNYISRHYFFFSSMEL